MRTAEKADRLRALHHGADMLVLPNAWDAASARIYEEAGFPAVGTSSLLMSFRIVVLPAPLRPTSASTSPVFTASEKRSSTAAPCGVRYETATNSMAA